MWGLGKGEEGGADEMLDLLEGGLAGRGVDEPDDGFILGVELGDLSPGFAEEAFEAVASDGGAAFFGDEEGDGGKRLGCGRGVREVKTGG
jgi:hypothetical protein